ncbi:MAG: phosphoribosylanthranilate isomerase [Gammaproteobacteria bacterium]|nr:phosphoribosylanthranilate isomerase [Gammaproteobacteria bacterium]
MAGQAARTRVRVKVCGITTPADAALAGDAGVDAVGINFFAGSPRAVSTDQAAAICAALPAQVAVVGVFVDPSEATVRKALGAARLDILQFHGSESAAFCRQFDTPYVKAVGVGPGFDFDTWQSGYADARALMLDGSQGGRSGGTGVPFDWTLWPRSDRLLVLAGGLTPDNVAAAIRRTRPFAVDVASGVEGATKGRKDPARLRSFLAAVADA